MAVLPGPAGKSSIGGGPLPVTPGEPLRIELEEFARCIRNRTPPAVTAAQAVAALRVAETIIDKIAEHSQLVKRTLASRKSTFPGSL